MQIQAKVSAKKQINEKIWQLDLRFIAPQEVKFQAGQFLRLKAAENHLRPYSIITPPSKKDGVSFCVDVSPMGVSSQYILGLKEGDNLEMDGPMGTMVVKDKSKDLLMIATGAGIAPFKSMIIDLLENGFDKKIRLVFGIRNEQSAFYFDEFEQLAKQHPNFSFIPCLSQPSAAWQRFTGRVTKWISENFAYNPEEQIFICNGPEAIKSIRDELTAKGAPAAKIKLEIFT